MQGTAHSERRVRLGAESFALLGRMPRVGEQAPDFELAFTRADPDREADADWEPPRLKTVTLGSFQRRRKILNIFPSIDTPVCARSVLHFESHAREYPQDAMLMISADLPFALQRFCGDHKLRNVFTLSLMNQSRFALDYGVLIADGPWNGLCARACLVIGHDDRILHSELCTDMGKEPDYEKALSAMSPHAGESPTDHRLAACR